MNPSRQVHVKPPGALLQTAKELQPPLFDAHSSISTPTDVTCRNNNCRDDDDDDDDEHDDVKVMLLKQHFARMSTCCLNLHNFCRATLCV